MSSKRIILADDEAIVRRVLRLPLERAGYEVEMAANGKEALERVLASPPDVLITDIEMPLMSGQELCQALETSLPDRKFPIWVATSLTAIEHREWSGSIDHLNFLEKPLSARKLVAALEEHFESCKKCSVSEVSDL